MNRYSNPYDGLSDGIQQGLRSMAQADVARSETAVRLAQIANDKQQRDRDYQLRVEQHNLSKNADRRADEVHRAELQQKARNEQSSLVAEFTDQNGQIKDIPKEHRGWFTTQYNNILESNQYAKETFGHLISTRSKGKYDSGRLVETPDGVAIEMYSSKNPSVRGVVTDLGSNDPNDKVTQHNPIEMISALETLDILRNQHGASPATAAYYLANQTGFANFESPPSNAVASRDAVSAGTAKSADNPVDPRDIERDTPSSTSTPYRDEFAASGTQNPRYKDPSKMPTILGRLGAVASNNVNAAQDFGAGVADAASKTGEAISNHWDKMKGGAADMKNDFMTGFSGEDPAKPVDTPTTDPTKSAPRSTTEAPAQYVTPTGRAQAPKDVSKEGISQYLEAGAQLVGKVAKDAASNKRILANMSAVEKKHSDALGRMLFTKVAGGMDPRGAAALYEGSRQGVRELTMMAISAPSDAEVMLKWMQSAGAKQIRGEVTQKDITSALKSRNAQIAGVIDDVNKSFGAKGQASDIPYDVSGGITDYMAVMGITDPMEQDLWVANNSQNIAEAISNVARNSATFREQGRDMRSVTAYTMGATMRRDVYAPPVIDGVEIDPRAYAETGMDLAAAVQAKYKSYLPLDTAMMVYKGLVRKSGGNIQISTEEVLKYMDQLPEMSGQPK